MGWSERTRQEGLRTKPIAKDSGRRPAAEAERLFKPIANEIRADKGLGAVMGLVWAVPSRRSGLKMDRLIRALMLG
jgi:hypothetical protein